MTPEERQAKLAELKSLREEIASLKKEQEAPEEPGMLEKAGHLLNLESGLGRAAVFGALEPVIGKDLVSMEQVKTGTVPSTEELIKQTGIDPLALGGGLVKNIAKLTGTEEPVRQAILKGAGIAGDIALDPATYLAAPLKAAQVARAGTMAGKALKLGEVLLNPIGEAVSAAGSGLIKGGKSLYKSAFEKADQALETRYGKGSIADLLKSKGFKGSAQDAFEKTQQLNEEAGKNISSFREQADLAGILEKPLGFKKAEDYIQKFRSSPDPKKMALADSLQETLDSYKKMPEKTATELADIKQMLRKDFGGESFMDNLRISQKPEEAELASRIYPEIAKAEDEAVKKAVSSKEYDQYLKAKKDYGITHKFTQKEINKLVNKEMTRTGILPSDVDLLYAGGALASGDPNAIAALMAKKGSNIMRLTGAKTRVGPAMEALGEGIQATAAKVPPQVWLEMLRNKPEGEQK